MITLFKLLLISDNHEEFPITYSYSIFSIDFDHIMDLFKRNKKASRKCG
jgi:hypothetical protein